MTLINGRCPKCGGMTFRDDSRYCICGWREPMEPFPDAMDRTATHAHKTINKYDELKREERKR